MAGVTRATRQGWLPVTERWSSSVGEKFAAVPSALFHHAVGLGLKSRHVLVLINLIDFWWDRDPVYPSYETQGRRIGYSAKTVQRAVDELEGMGLIRVDRSRTEGSTNRIDLAPLDRRLGALERLRERGQNVSTGQDDPTSGQFVRTPEVNLNGEIPDKMSTEAEALRTEASEEEPRKDLLSNHELADNFAELRKRLRGTPAGKGRQDESGPKEPAV